jgi:hypothetical protein
MALVAIGNGLFARTRTRESLMDAYRRKQRTCQHAHRDPRGMCYKCGNVDPTSTGPEWSPAEPKGAADAGRLRKATALLILLLRAKLDAGLVELMTEAEWHQVAQVARVRFPSRETREAVLGMMRTIETPLIGAIQ